MAEAPAPVRIHGYPVSTWTRTACMVAIEKGIAYELVPIAYGGSEHEAMNPFKKIPVLEHQGRVISEGLAITGYLDEAFPGPSLQPADLLARTRMRTWMSVCGLGWRRTSSPVRASSGRPTTRRSSRQI